LEVPVAKKDEELILRTLASSLDKVLANKWGATNAVLLMARSADDDDEQLEIQALKIFGHPADTLHEIPADKRYVAACLSTLGYRHNLANLQAGRQARVRATVAVGKTRDFTIMRHKGGPVDELVGMTGPTGELLRRLLQGC
jgi:hypothetical protein